MLGWLLLYVLCGVYFTALCRSVRRRHCWDVADYLLTIWGWPVWLAVFVYAAARDATPNR